MEIKQEIIDKHDRGSKVRDLAKEYGRNTSTICTLLKQKEAIKSRTPFKGSTVLSSKRIGAHEEMEKLLLVWIQEKQLAGDSISEAFICEKARTIYSDLRKRTQDTAMEDTPSTSTGKTSKEINFQASSGWFKNFKKRSGIHSVVRHGDAASSDAKAAKEFVTHFAELIEAEGYIPQQVWNCDETGLFWKKLPRNTFITKEEKALPGHKPMKDRITLALCANASGYCKVEPLLVYHWENPRAFRTHKIIKENLNVMWRSNPKAWMTKKFFTEWVNVEFGPTVKRYLADNNLPQQALLVLDNAPAHPPGLKDDIKPEYQFIDILYLPPNTTPLLQPMDQQVISNFKKLYTKHLFKRCFDVTENTNLTLREFWKDHFNMLICLRLIDTAWQGVTRRTLNASWSKLWPEVRSERDFEGFGPDGQGVEHGPHDPDEPPEERGPDDPALVEDIVSMGKAMGLDVDNNDVNELVAEHEEELTTVDLQQLHAEQQSDLVQEIADSNEDNDEPETTSSSEIKNILGMWETISNFIETKHPEKVKTGRATVLFDDTCLMHFRNILKGRKKQTSIDKFFSSESVGKKAKTNEEN